PYAPYTILANRDIDFATMQRLVRFARYWDLVANSGRFAHTLPVLLADDAFGSFMAFSDWLYANTDATHRIALDRLAAMVSRWLQARGMGREDAERLLASDYAGRNESGSKVKAAESPAPKRQARRLAAWAGV